MPTKLIWHTEKRRVRDLVPSEGNPRQMSTEQAAQLQRSLEKFGLVEIPVVCGPKDNTIVAGHMRHAVLLQSEHDTEEIDVRVPSRKLTPSEFKEYRVRSNKNTGSWDWDGLLNTHSEEELLDWGFTVEELSGGQQEDEDDDGRGDAAPDVPEEPKACLGELWTLGEHRLLCGDATNVEHVERLMAGEKADMVFTDPPYGVSVVKSGHVGGRNVAKLGEYSSVVGDETTDTARAVYHVCVALNVPMIVFWGGNYFCDFLPPSPMWLVWDKRGDMASNNFADCELAWTNGTKPARVHKQTWAGMIREGEPNKRVHPTQKPIGLAEWAFGVCGEPDTILDFFGGSGSTLIACEKLDRKCRMMEIDPRYCDVILQRWAEYTEQTPVREDGVTWADLQHKE